MWLLPGKELETNLKSKIHFAIVVVVVVVLKQLYLLLFIEPEGIAQLRKVEKSQLYWTGKKISF